MGNELVVKTANKLITDYLGVLRLDQMTLSNSSDSLRKAAEVASFFGIPPDTKITEIMPIALEKAKSHFGNLDGEIRAENIEELETVLMSRAKALEDFRQLVKLVHSEQPSDPTSQGTSHGNIAKLCHLRVKETELGREVTFKIPEGMNGRSLLHLIEENNPRKNGDGVVRANNYLWRDAGLVYSNGPETFKLMVINDQALVKDSEFIDNENLTLSRRFMATLAGALFRDRYGFPKNRDEIGTAKDRGDLFFGLPALTDQGAIKTSLKGIQRHNKDKITPEEAITKIVSSKQ